MRKKVTYLNILRHDVLDILEDIQQTGVDIDSACYDLSQIHAHDVKTESANVKVLFDKVLDEHSRLGKQLDSFRIARNKYLEFF